MKTMLIAACATAVLAVSFQAANAGYFFNSGKSAARAGALTRACDGNAPWKGWFSGNRWDRLLDENSAYSARACFATEADCRAWGLLQMDVLNGGAFLASDCKRR